MEDRWELGQLVSQLTRDDLEDARAPLPSLGSWLPEVQWTVIRRLSRSAREAEWPAELQRMTEDLVTALYGQLRPWMFLLHGLKSGLCCAYGSEGVSPLRLPSLLRSAFPDAALDRELDKDAPLVAADALLKLSSGVSLTGIPTPRAGPQIDRLCGVLRSADSEWAYLLRAEPVPAKDIRQSLKETQELLFEVGLRYSAQGQPAMQIRADRANSLLGPALKRFERGRALGMWRCRAWLLSESVETWRLGAPVLGSAFSGEASLPVPMRTHVCQAAAVSETDSGPLDSMLAATLARPPLEDYPGYEVLPRIQFGLQAPVVSAGAKDRVTIASILNHTVETGQRLEIARTDLTKHALVAGVTGSGKTTTCVRLLKEAKTPFLVIEPAKSEYRDKVGGPGVMVFTAGDENDSPLRLNPLEVPRHTLVQTHIDYLKALFMAAFVLYSPMPQVLETSLQQVYEDRGWNLATNRNSRGEDHPRRFPRLSDLIAKVNKVASSLGYSPQTESDIRAALTARLESLRAGGGKGPMFDVRTSVPDEVLFEHSCVLEMKEIVNDDEKAFLIGLVLVRLYEYLEGRQKANPQQAGGLRHLTLIEEAHRLLRNIPAGQGDFANPKGHAVETFSNMLAEIRAYGEGIVIAEQLPSKLAPDVIKNTNLKIVHRMVAHEDRLSLGAAINLPEEATSYMTRLLPGRALAYAEGLQRPVLVSIRPAPPANSGQPSKEPPVWTAPPAEDISWVDRLLDVPLRTAFLRLFNSLRRAEPDAELFVDALDEFVSTCNRTTINEVDEGKWWSVLAEREVENRGAFHHWPHTRVEEAIQLAGTIFRDSLDALSVLYEGDDNDSERARVVDGIRSGLERFSTLWRSLADLAGPFRPFPGCEACDLPCHFRYDMERRVESEKPSAKAPVYSVWGLGVLKAAVEAASEGFPDDDLVTRQRAALCFGIQQMGKGAVGILPKAAQNQWAEKFKETLPLMLNHFSEEARAEQPV